MATQITHIVIANKLYTQYFSHHNKRDFFIGNIFPDIRYVGKIDRDRTHDYTLVFSDILNESNAFHAGVKLHCLADMAREAFVTREGVYTLFSTLGHKYTIPKLLEDELFYSKVKDWDEVIAFLDTIIVEELAYGMSQDVIKNWHQNLQHYFATPPSDETRFRHATALGMAPEVIHEMNTIFARYRSQPRAQQIAQSFYTNLESLVTSWHPSHRVQEVAS